jgi:1,2-diacylglycerol 3-alpha-glucosyltransferase
MKILISTDTYYPHVNGASYFTQRLAYNLHAHGHDVCVIAPSQSYKDTDTVINSVRVFGVHSYSFFFYHKFRFCLLFFRNKFIEKIIEDFQPDIIHLQGHFAVSRQVVAIAKEKHIPLVATNHFMPENLVHYLPLHTLIGPPIKKMAWRDFSKVFKEVGQVTTPTETAARLIQSYFKRPIIAVSCGINIEIFNPKNDGTYLKKRYNMAKTPILLFVGRLDKEKNIDMVIESFARAVKKIPFQLVVVGDGTEKNNLIELSKKIGVEKNVIFTGFVSDEDLPNLYAASDCFIIAGTAELQSIVTMEAMASGLPILGVNAIALPELVKDGKNGFLFEYGDIDGLSEKMVVIFSNDEQRKAMGQESLALVAKHDMKNSIKKFEDIYSAELHEQHTQEDN